MSKPNVKMNAGFCLVKQMEATSPGGLVLPNQKQENHAIVQEIGPNRITDYGVEIKSFAQVGDRILFTQGYPMTVDGVEYLVVEDRTILAVVGRIEM